MYCFPSPACPPSPNLTSCSKVENGEPIRGLQTELAIHGFRGFDRRERNLQPEIAAKKNFARFEQRFPFGLLLPEPHRAVELFPPLISRYTLFFAAKRLQ